MSAFVQASLDSSSPTLPAPHGGGGWTLQASVSTVNLRLDWRGSDQLQRFDAPAVGVAYWVIPNHWMSSVSTERNHLQRCMEPEVCRMEPEACCISLEAEVPEVLFEGMREFLNDHPNWDQYRLISSALASFLFQNGCSDQGVTQHYLNGLFRRR